eukprot:760764-Hanusia_phi.AAC.4
MERGGRNRANHGDREDGGKLETGHSGRNRVRREGRGDGEGEEGAGASKVQVLPGHRKLCSAMLLAVTLAPHWVHRVISAIVGKF